MRKTTLSLFFVFTLLGTFTASAQEVPSAVIDALNKGNATTISSYLNDNVELYIDNKNDIYSKQQASKIIADFFSKNSVTGFNVIHKGEKEATCFTIGTLRTTTNTYRVYILTRKNGNKDVIQQFRIEPSND